MSGGWGWAWDGEGGGIIGIGQGAANYLLSFDGTAYGNCGSGASIDDLHDGAMTVEAWVNHNVAWGSYGMLFSKYSVGPNIGWYFAIKDRNALQAVINCATTSGAAQQVSGGLSVGDWHHVRMTWDDASYQYPRLWMGGTEVAYGSTTNRVGAVVSGATLNLGIGARNTDWGLKFVGNMSWLRISNIVRNTVNFTPPARCTPPVVDGNTVLLLKLLEGSGATAADSSGNGNDAALTNVTWQPCS